MHWTAGKGSHHPGPLFRYRPIPAEDNGYWDWDDPNEGKGVIGPAATPGKAKFNMFNIPITLTRWVTKLPLLGDGQVDFKMSSIKPKKLLPHWEMKVILHNTDGSHTVECCWHLLTGRKKTT